MGHFWSPLNSLNLIRIFHEVQTSNRMKNSSNFYECYVQSWSGSFLDILLCIQWQHSPNVILGFHPDTVLSNSEVFFSSSGFPGRNLSFCCQSLHHFPCVTTCTVNAALKHILLNYDPVPQRHGILCNTTLFSLFSASIALYDLLAKTLHDHLNTHNMIID